VRQGQQNRRGRGRNNNRKTQNPLARSFESNGPDVKVRGTPSHIAEKYISLARDAQSSGDPVLEQNYLQHAEHYSRIIMAYREQMQQSGELNGSGPRPGEGTDEMGDDEGEEGLEDFPHASQQQPQQHGRPQGGYDANRHERPFRRDRDQGRFRDRDRDRYSGGDNRGGDRDRGGDRERYNDTRSHQHQHQHQPQGEGRGQSHDRAEAHDGGGSNSNNNSNNHEGRRRDRFQQPHEQPEFLRRPVRRARSEGEEPKDDTSHE
jgi:hypothetical protein